LNDEREEIRQQANILVTEKFFASRILCRKLCRKSFEIKTVM